MSDSSKLTQNDLEAKLDLLIKRFYEQKGIIDSYIVREREWKKDKIIHRKEINKLERDLNKLKNS
ncbi:MAG: hypothetical protein CMD58_01565 [Gammaproteobacteria bacterium]|nr:hypothetical protein [Gammaproteobacteria bacterium]|tara:strand:+ start:1603 stop:1797 length:195 start_codon:yes stop_codon:yes gene_type:complete